jgi:hypothetical protein
MPKSEIDDLDKPIFGAKAIAEVLPDRNLKQVYYGLKRGLIDADKFGRLYVSTPRRLLNQFSGRGGGGCVMAAPRCGAEA